MSTRPKVLVAGVSGLVGYAAAKRFAQDPRWDVVGVARRRPERLGPVDLVSVDLTDRDACHATFSTMHDITHVVYAALFEKPGIFAGWRERDQMETNLRMMQNLLDPLLAASPVEHIALLQGTKAYGAHVGLMKVPGRERDPRVQHENFYWLQEDDLLGRQAAAGFAWSILRPVVIFGEALGSNLNPIPALGTYAAVLRARGLPLHYPGGYATVIEGVDADLLADAIFWTATSPACRNQTFNVANGDVFSLDNEWAALAAAFGMEVGDRVPMALAEEMPNRQGDWADVHSRFDLVSPVDVMEFVGQSFLYADLLLGRGVEHPTTTPSLVSTIKARQFGFQECLDTRDMFGRLIAHLQRERLLPPRDW